MGAWTVSETGLIYEMEYTNGFKRAIRKSQIAKSNTYQGIDYSSSQNPNLVLAKILASIQSFTTGTSTIDFTNNGGDDWTAGFKIAPTSYHPSTIPIVSYDWAVTFWSGGSDTGLGSGNETSDFDFDTTGNGAGVYDLDITYNLSDGSTFELTKLVLVDASGIVLASVEAGGVVVNSVIGLLIDLSAIITQVGVFYTITWGALVNGGGVLLPQTGANVLLTLPLGATKIFTVLTLDSTFTNDYGANGKLVGSEVTIS